MKKIILLLAISILLIIAIFGLPPFKGGPTADYAQGDPDFKTEVKRLPNGIYEVSALTPMPGVTPEMVRWWFADYMQTSEHYERWYPGAHLWMDWENKVSGEYVGASHLVHEYIGEDLQKLRIQFVPPEEILGTVQLRKGDVAVCAKPGLLDEPINGGQMCHIILATENGAEMRSRFWLGMVAKREGNDQVSSMISLVANTYLARTIGVRQSAALDLMDHCTTEMAILAEFLPALYAAETGSTDPDGSLIKTGTD